MSSTISGISWLHMASLLVFLLILAGIGFYLKNRVKSSEDYWVGGREIGPVTTAISYCAAYTSTVAVIGSSAMYYLYGLGYAVLEMLGTTVMVCTFTFVLIGLKMRAVSERINAVSLPGFLAMRFESNAARLISGAMIAVMTIPYGVAALKGIADVLEVTAGVPYAWGVILISATALAYMVSSGYWGVATTDLIQGLVISVAVGALAWVAYDACGGVTEIVSGLQRTDPDLLRIPGPLPWGLFFSYSLVWALIVFGQPQLVTKYMGLKDARTMGTVIITSIVWEGLFLISLMLIGLGGRCLLGGELVNNADLLPPTIASRYGSTFVSVLFLIGCMAAGLSTIAALFLTSSAAVTKDIYEDGMMMSRGRTLDTQKAIRLSRIITGIVIVATVALALRPWDIVFHMSTAAAGAMGAAFTAPTFMGLYWKRATRAGCIAAMIGGGATSILWAVYDMGFTHMFVPGTVVSFILFIAVSLCTQAPKQETIDLFFRRGYAARQG